MKALIVGMGSAGQRHMRNLKRVLGDSIEFIAYRVRRLPRTFDDNLKVLDGQNVSAVYNVKEYYDLEEALKQEPDFAIIANPNSKHIETAIQIAEAGVDFFLEKPLSHNLDRVEELKQIVEEKNIVAYVGFQMRKHPCIQRLREDIRNNSLGNIISVDCCMGELITSMHSYEDYRGMIESNQSMGGGVVICQIHEIDYLTWIFGMPSEVFSIGGKYSDLEFDVEDSVTTIMKYYNEVNTYPIVLHQDFLQFPPRRQCVVIGTKGKVDMDLLTGRYSRTIDGRTKVFDDSAFERNDMFIKELNDFLECLKRRKKNNMSIAEGERSLRTAMAIKKSIFSGNFEKVSL